jgi:hypothetical protein
MIELIETYRSNPLRKFFIGAHSPYSCPPEQIQDALGCSASGHCPNRRWGERTPSTPGATAFAVRALAPCLGKARRIIGAGGSGNDPARYAGSVHTHL